MIEELYTTGKYLETNPDWHVHESPWKARQILGMLDRHRLAPKSICEVGCGAGEVLKQLQDHMPNDAFFYGYDISPIALELCRSRANDRLQFRLGDVAREKDLLFDLILVLDVLEHLEDYFGFLRALRPKASYKLFHIPLDLSVQTLLRRDGLPKRRRLHGHLHYFTRETALQTLDDTGYRVLGSSYTPRSIDLGSERGQRVLRIPRKVLAAMRTDFAARLLGGFSLLVLAQ